MEYRQVAKFADGYIYRVNKADVSVFDSSRNGTYDIQTMLPPIHGPVVRLGLTKGRLHKTNWVSIPQDAKPVYEVRRNKSLTINIDGSSYEKSWNSAFTIGYEKNGKRRVMELTA